MLVLDNPATREQVNQQNPSVSIPLQSVQQNPLASVQWQALSPSSRLDITFYPFENTHAILNSFLQLCCYASRLLGVILHFQFLLSFSPADPHNFPLFLLSHSRGFDVLFRCLTVLFLSSRLLPSMDDGRSYSTWY